MIRLPVIKWETRERIRKIIKVIGRIIFFGVAFIGWFFFGFLMAVAYKLFKFLE